MDESQLFIEYFMIGFQTLLWLIIAIIAFIPLNISSFTPRFNSNNGLDIVGGIIIAIPICYPLGVIIDEFADKLLRKNQNQIRARYITDKKRDLSIITLIDSSLINLHEYLEGLKKKMRIARSTFLNGIFAVISISLMTILKYNGFDSGVSLFNYLAIEVVVGLVIIISAFIVWKEITITFYKQLARAGEYIHK